MILYLASDVRYDGIKRMQYQPTINATTPWELVLQLHYSHETKRDGRPLKPAHGPNSESNKASHLSRPSDVVLCTMRTKVDRMFLTKVKEEQQ